MTHHHLRFHSSCSFKCNAYYDEYRSTAHCDIQLCDNSEYDREDSDYTQEHCTDQSDLTKDLLEVIAGGLTGSYARYAAVVLPEVVSDLDRVVRHTYIEVVERDDENEIQTSIERMSVLKPVKESCIEGTRLRLAREELERLGDRHKAHRKDDGENAAHRDLDRDVSVLTAVLLSADYALCILYRYPSLGIVHEDDEADHQNEYHDDDRNKDHVSCLACLHKLEQSEDSLRTSCDDTCEQKHRNTVAYTVFIDPVAQPYSQRSACHEAEDNDNFSEISLKGVTCVLNYLKTVNVHQCSVVSPALEQCNTECSVLGDLVQSLSAFHTLLRESFQRRQCIGQQLYNDLRVDVRTN